MYITYNNGNQETLPMENSMESPCSDAVEGVKIELSDIIFIAHQGREAPEGLNNLIVKLCEMYPLSKSTASALRGLSLMAVEDPANFKPLIDKICASRSPAPALIEEIGHMGLSMKLEDLCGVCPEDYDVTLDGVSIGYFRLRGGHFTVSYGCGYGDFIMHAFPEGSGEFEPDERDAFLEMAAIALAHEHIERTNTLNHNI